MIVIEEQIKLEEIDNFLEQVFGPARFCSYCINTATCVCENKQCKKPLCDECAIRLFNLEIYYCSDCLESLSSRSDVA